MKKFLSILCVLALSVSMLAGCGSASTKSSAKLSIVTTIFPEYDWVREITKGCDDVEVTLLLDKGVELHSFHPSVDNIVKLSTCDVFIYVGGESDEWVEDALAEATNKEMVAINLLEILGDSVKEEELVEGMKGTKEAEGENPEYDEHVWLSLKNAKSLVSAIADELGQKDASNKALYEKNANAYISSLDALDKDYEAAVAAASKKTVLFGDRFPFRYMVDDYGIDYFAAFAGCVADSNASFETITFLAKKIDELDLSAILQIESADGKIAATIKDITASKNQEILTLDSMQSVTAKDVADGATYLGIMKENLEVLKQALK